MTTDMNENAWRTPELYREVFAASDARAIVLKHQGRILACGTRWDIVAGEPSVGTVTLTLRKTEGSNVTCVHLDRLCPSWEACATRTAKASASRYREAVMSLAEMVRLRRALEEIRDGKGYGPEMAEDALKATPAHVVIPPPEMLAAMVRECAAPVATADAPRGGAAK